MSSLFRKEVFESRKQSYLGNIILHVPTTFGMITALISSIILIIILFLVLADYSRKERVSGVLVPNKGLVTIVPAESGVYENIFVKAGDFVEINKPLFRLKDEKNFSNGVSLDQKLLDQMRLEKETLILALNNVSDKYVHTKNRLSVRKQGFEEEVSRYKNQIKIQEDLVELEEKNYRKHEGLFRQQVINETLLDASRKEYLNELKDLNALKTTIGEISAEIEDIDAQMLLLPTQEVSEKSNISREIYELEQGITRVNASGSAIINAPVSGVVAAVTARLGQQASPTRTALSILPSGGKLEAHLYIPSRAIAFVSVGQTVHLRYDAFPYQKFGIYPGVVTEISKTVLQSSDAEMAPLLQEPFFLVIAEVLDTEIQAYGEKFPLQSGMTLSADIILEKRKLWEWLFEPLLGVLN